MLFVSNKKENESAFKFYDTKKITRNFCADRYSVTSKTIIDEKSAGSKEI